MSAQDRLNRLLPNRRAPKYETTAQNFAEQELQRYEDRRKLGSFATIQTTDRSAPHAEAGGSDVGDATSLQDVGKATSQLQHDHLPGIAPNATAFVPQGLPKGRLAAASFEAADDSEDIEPISSSTELVGIFCLFGLVAKFPYKYMQDSDSQVSRAFFAAEKVYARTWDMHYLHHPGSLKPLMFVPVGQVQQLIEAINAKFNIETKIPRYPFQTSFYRGTPCPIRLGTVNSKQEMLDKQDLIPGPALHFDKAPINATEAQKQDYMVWREKIERAVEAQKNKKTASKHKLMKQQWNLINDAKTLRRTQGYLGIQSSTSDTSQPGFNANVQANYPIEEPILISVDVESWESDHKIITEIGISTLDTLDLKNLAPEAWSKRIRSRHFRIKGRERFANHRFVKGHPDDFRFGRSEFVDLADAARAVDSCFADPFSAGFEFAGPQYDESGTPMQQLPIPAHGSTAENGNVRNVILVGHGVGGDIDYLVSLGCSIFALDGHNPSPPFLETLDTAVLYKSLTNDTTTRSLTRICQELEIQAFFLHNAGNDARYTLEVLLKTALKAETQSSEGKVSGESEVLNVPRVVQQMSKDW